MKTVHVALTGNPNCGKSTLFNALTGMNQKTGNFPGTTVESRRGRCRITSDISAEITDLPGTYSLYPKSGDERVAVDALLGVTLPHVVVVVADAANLKRSLLLCTQVIDLGIPTVLALNMMDVAVRKGIQIDVPKLSQLLGIAVVPVNARKREGQETLQQAIATATAPAQPYWKVHPAVAEFLEELKPVIDGPNLYNRLLKAHRVNQASHEKQNIYRVYEKYNFDSGVLQKRESLERFRLIEFLLLDCLTTPRTAAETPTARRVDALLTHWCWGFLAFFSILFVVFQSIFSLAQVPMELLEGVFEQMQQAIHTSWPQGWLASLVADGIVAGLGGVIVFLPQIVFLFAFITLLEDSGYMARVSFITDRLMRAFGLNGRSVVPLMGGMACAVPSIMATRTIQNTRDRLITMMVIPLMPCSARLPVYTLLIGLLAPPQYYFGFISLQGLLLFAMYILGFVVAMLTALVLKWLMKNREKTGFVMELPTFKWPSCRNLWLSVFDRGKTFVLQAGFIIVGVSVVLWYLGSYGPAESMQRVEKQFAALQAGQPDEDIVLQKQAALLEASYAGHFGHFIEPVIKPLGFDWKIGIALLSSFAAREVFVGTMNTLYSIGSSGSTLHQQFKIRYRPLTALSLMLFYAFALQCTSTIAVVYRETRSIKWPAIQLLFMTAMAWLASFSVWQLGS